MPGIACLFVVLMAITLRSPDDLRSVRSRAELLTPSKPTDN